MHSKLHIFVALIAAGSVAAAVWLQTAYDAPPCAWCILQRIILIAIAIVAAGAAIQDMQDPFRERQRTMTAPCLILGFSIAGIAAVAAQISAQHTATISCAQSLATYIVEASKLDRLWPLLFEIKGSCATASFHLAGIPLVGLSGMLFALIGYLYANYLKNRHSRG